MTLLERIIEMLPLTWIDAAAVALVVIVWAAYQWYADFRATQRPHLGREMERFTREWLTRMVERDNRMVDVNVLRNLTRSSQFFASTTMLILGALVALMAFANRNFNQGLRGYYFGVAALSWFLHPALMMVVTLGVLYVLHQREFRSRTLDILLRTGKE